MTQPTRAQTLRWDIFKGIVALILLILLILLLLRGCGTLGIGPVVPVPSPSEESTEDTQAGTLPQILSPADGAKIDRIMGDEMTIKLEGTGAVGSTLDVLDGDEVIGSTVVGSDGRFSTELSPTTGVHVYTVRDSVNTDLVSSPVQVSIDFVIVDPSPTPSPVVAVPTATNAPTVAAQPTSTSGEGDTCDYSGVVIRGYKPDKFHYVVGTCDTMSSIAAALGIKLSALIAANPQIENPDIIYAGQVLNLP